jgi:Zn-dependent M16 (insulinase) family peptidase
MSWLLPPVTDSLSLVTYEVLSEVLIGSAGSPLRKNLVDSGLGEDLSPVSGLETDFREMVFGVGLRGTDPHREEQVRSLVNDTLSSLCSRGLDRSLVTSTINRVEFRHREIRGNGSPYALRLMGRALRGWVHGGDPFASLEFSAVMARFKEILANDERHLERRIADDLLANNHRLTLVVGPDPEQERRDVEEESQRLETTVARLSPEEKGQVLREAEAFRAYQLAPDSPEVLSLTLSLHDLFTNEIVYLDLCFPTGSIDAERALLLPLFGKAVCGSGLPGAGYDKIALELFRLTGGFSSSLDAGGIVGEPRSFGQFAFFRMRCLRALLPEGASLIGRLLASADFRDLGRLRDIVLELRNDMKSSLIPQGHHFAMLRAASRLSDSVAREETWRGISQLLFLEDLGKGLDEKLPGLAEKLEGIRADLFARSNLVANATAARECFGEIEKAVEDFASRLPAAPALVASAGAATSKTDAQRSAARSSAGPESAEIPRRTESAEIPRRTESAEIPRRTESAEIPRRGEAMISSSSVGYVARALRGFRYEEAESGAAAVLGHILSTSYLWEKVRMEGGAYGAFSYPRNTDGLFLFGSYRDPHIARTLRAFQDALDAAVRGDFGSSEVEKAVIGTVGREERPLDPGEKGFVSLQRKLHGVTDEVRQERRDRLVAVDPAALADAARKLRTFFDQGFSAVISNRKALGEAAAELPELGGRPVDLPE